MTVTSFQVQKVLRTYGRNLSRSRRFLQESPQPKERPPDSVNISAKARRLHLLEGVASGIIRNMGQSGAPDQPEKEAVARLSQEYGEPLAIVDADSDGMRFAIVDPETDELQRCLSPEESSELQARLAEITVEIVDRNMMRT